MKDDSEGFMITDVEEHYNSDEESESKYIHYIVYLVFWFSSSLQIMYKNSR